MQISEILNTALLCYDQQNFDAATKYADKILKTEPQNISALLIKGNVCFQNHQIEESLQYYQTVLQIDPQNKTAMINAANAAFILKNYQVSYQLAQQVLQIDSLDKTALTIYGNSCIELEKFDQAKKTFLLLLQIDSQEPWNYNSLSTIYQKTQDEKRALACGWKAVELSNGDEKQHLNFGYLLYELSDDSKINYAQQWQKKYGDNAIVKHMSNAILHQQKITKADSEYVQKLFDEFADDFEDVLTSLEYRAPQLLAREMKEIYQPQILRKKQILDLGCGTGWCGNFLKKYTSKKYLYGVDMSEKMLSKAIAKKCYGKLIKADLEQYLETTESRFDIIVAADVFTYFGDLQKVIQGCFRTLKKQGWILFTVSANLSNEKEYDLHDSGRFIHHKKYVMSLLEKKGFSIEKISEEILRNEGEKTVIGYVIRAQKK